MKKLAAFMLLSMLLIVPVKAQLDVSPFWMGVLSKDDGASSLEAMGVTNGAITISGTNTVVSDLLAVEWYDPSGNTNYGWNHSAIDIKHDTGNVYANFFLMVSNQSVTLRSSTNVASILYSSSLSNLLSTQINNTITISNPAISNLVSSVVSNYVNQSINTLSNWVVGHVLTRTVSSTANISGTLNNIMVTDDIMHYNIVGNVTSLTLSSSNNPSAGRAKSFDLYVENNSGSTYTLALPSSWLTTQDKTLSITNGTTALLSVLLSTDPNGTANAPVAAYLYNKTN